MAYFTDQFSITTEILEQYGAFNISLINDLPLFIDPFLLYGSSKPIYKDLHNSILKYLEFLRIKSARGRITDQEIASWYMFSEVKQNWLGFSKNGNGGSGLGREFGMAMSSYMHIIFQDLHEEKISQTSHLEKATLFQIGVGKDNISDFTCNLIKAYLLEYTETFAKMHLKSNQIALFNVPKAYFDYTIERWMPKAYFLPVYQDDFVLLTPKDILTKDENWINSHDLQGNFLGVCSSIPNEQFRGEIHSFYKTQLPAPSYVGKGKRRKQKQPTAKEIAIAINNTLKNFPTIIDYYIKTKEANPEKAKSLSDEKVNEVYKVFIENVTSLINILLESSDFYSTPTDSYTEALARVNFMKDVIEKNDGYRLFYLKGEPIKREADLQLIYRLTWFSSPFDVNREVNNGRGPVDYAISSGATDKCLIEFKLASNSKLKMNLQNQSKVYEAANSTDRTIKVILYFDSAELAKVNNILKDLNLQNDDSIILIDAGNNKISASNVK